MSLVDAFGHVWRKRLYTAYGFVGVGLGAVPVWCAATSVTTPSWTLGALAVYAFVGGPLFGNLAASNARPDHWSSKFAAPTETEES